MSERELILSELGRLSTALFSVGRAAENFENKDRMLMVVAEQAKCMSYMLDALIDAID